MKSTLFSIAISASRRMSSLLIKDSGAAET
jgi:hypothetical protein